MPPNGGDGQQVFEKERVTDAVIPMMAGARVEVREEYARQVFYFESKKIVNVRH